MHFPRHLEPLPEPYGRPIVFYKDVEDRQWARPEPRRPSWPGPGQEHMLNPSWPECSSRPNPLPPTALSGPSPSHRKQARRRRRRAHHRSATAPASHHHGRPATFDIPHFSQASVSPVFSRHAMSLGGFPCTPCSDYPSLNILSQRSERNLLGDTPTITLHQAVSRTDQDTSRPVAGAQDDRQVRRRPFKKVKRRAKLSGSALGDLTNHQNLRIHGNPTRSLVPALSTENGPEPCEEPNVRQLPTTKYSEPRNETENSSSNLESDCIVVSELQNKTENSCPNLESACSEGSETKLAISSPKKNDDAVNIHTTKEIYVVLELTNVDKTDNLAIPPSACSSSVTGREEKTEVIHKNFEPTPAPLDNLVNCASTQPLAPIVGGLSDPDQNPELRENATASAQSLLDIPAIASSSGNSDEYKQPAPDSQDPPPLIDLTNDDVDPSKPEVVPECSTNDILPEVSVVQSSAPANKKRSAQDAQLDPTLVKRPRLDGAVVVSLETALNKLCDSGATVIYRTNSEVTIKSGRESGRGWVLYTSISSNRGEYYLHSIPRHQLEFVDIKNFFDDTCRGKQFTVTRIRRVYNENLISRFRDKLSMLESQNGEIAVVRLFHGTLESNLESICKGNFDFRLAGRSSSHTWFGAGVNFSPISFYASHYGDLGCSRIMFICDVLVGSVCSINRPKSGRPSSEFDTNIKSPIPQVVCKFGDDEFYPSYIVDYTVPAANHDRHQYEPGYVSYQNYYGNVGYQNQYPNYNLNQYPNYNLNQSHYCYPNVQFLDYKGYQEF